MSGLYNLVLGDGREQDRGSVLITTLNIDPQDVPRFRDAWIETDPDHEAVFVLYTRAGGGNRDDYESEIGALRDNPYYLSDSDDETDSTYALFRFRVPTVNDVPEHMRDWQTPWPEYRQQLVDLAVEPIDMSKRWADAIAAIGGGQ